MATTPRVPVPDHAVGPDGVVAMSKVLEHHVPAVAAARRAFFDELAAVVAEDPALHEVVRLATAEHTGCRLCRNVRNEAAVDAGVDEPLIDRVRRGEVEDLDERTRAGLELAASLRGDVAAGAGAVTRAAATLGARDAAAVLVSAARSLTDGKTLVALGLEPEVMPVKVV